MSLQDDLVALYRALYALVDDHSAADLSAMFHGNAWRLYKLGGGLTA